jgi:hypothetical protein
LTHSFERAWFQPLNLKRDILVSKCAVKFNSYRYSKAIVDSPWFGNTFVVFIFVNTIVLAMEYDGMSEEYSNALSQINLILTIAFMAEMALKVVGMGVLDYVADSFNVFDAFVVLISIVELSLSGSGGLSALRAFRILRVLKLIRSWTNLQHFLYKIYLTVLDLGNFFFIVCLTIFIFALLGMQMFGGTMCVGGLALDGSDAGAGAEASAEVPRHHFDTLLWALVTVFQVLTGEDWNFVMYDSMATSGNLSALYFVALLVIGNFLVLNLFVAILLTNFGAQELPLADEYQDAKSVLKGYGGMTHSGSDEQKRREKFWAELPDKDFSPGVVSGWERIFEAAYTEIQAEEDRVAAEKRAEMAAEEEARLARIASEDRARSEGGTPKAGQQGQLSEQSSEKSSSSFSSLKDSLSGAAEATGGSIARSWRGGCSSMPGAAPNPLHTFKGKALGVFTPTNPFRKFCFTLVDDRRFDWTIMFFIVVSSFTMIFESPKAMEDHAVASILDVVDTVFTIIFALEMLVKLVAFGLYFGEENAYLRDAWNCMDGFIVVLGIVGKALAGYNLGWVRALRTLVGRIHVACS